VTVRHFGASGLTFFDDDDTEFFSPRAARESVMFLIAWGKSVKEKALKIGFLGLVWRSIHQ
jgi:hypothetical protein